MVGNDEINFPHKLLLGYRQVANLRKVFANKSSTDIKLSKTQISKMIQSGGFLGRLLGPLLKTGLPLIKNVIKPLAKSVLIPLGLTAAASAADAGIHKKILGSGKQNNTTTLIISNDEMKNITEIVASLEDSSLLPEGVSETIQNEAKEQKGEFLTMLLGTLRASLLGNILAGKGIDRTVYSKDNLPKTKYGAYVINPDEYSDIGIHWIALHVQNNDATYFDSFGVEHIPEEIKTFIGNKNIKTNIFRIQAYDSIMCGYFCTGFIDFMFTGKTLKDFTNLFSLNNF